MLMQLRVAGAAGEMRGSGMGGSGRVARRNELVALSFGAGLRGICAGPERFWFWFGLDVGDAAVHGNQAGSGDLDGFLGVGDGDDLRAALSGLRVAARIGLSGERMRSEEHTS